jgi:hypothetical protein
MWPQRTARVEQLVPVGRVGRQRAVVELASRGWRLDALRRGGATGRLWRREPSPVAAAAAPKPAAPAAAKTAPKPAAPARNAAKFAPKPLPAPPTVAGPAAQPAAAPKPAAPVTPPVNGAPPPMPIPRQQTPEGGAAAGTE